MNEGFFLMKLASNAAPGHGRCWLSRSLLSAMMSVVGTVFASTGTFARFCVIRANVGARSFSGAVCAPKLDPAVGRFIAQPVDPGLRIVI